MCDATVVVVHVTEIVTLCRSRMGVVALGNISVGKRPGEPFFITCFYFQRGRYEDFLKEQRKMRPVILLLHSVSILYHYFFPSIMQEVFFPFSSREKPHDMRKGALFLEVLDFTPGFSTS